MKNENKFLKMSANQFDKYMCQTYPLIFKDRKGNASNTCMVWGFCVGKGWYNILDKLCQKLDLMYKVTGILTVASQIKEKFGSLRFYMNIVGTEQIRKEFKENSSVVCDIIYDCVKHAEDESEFTCANCGNHIERKVVSGTWVHDVCETCFKKLYPDRKINKLINT